MQARPAKPTIRVLIAEPQPVYRQGLIHLLQRSYKEIKCTGAETGYQALQLLKANRFNLLLLGIQQPGLKGWEFLQKIIAVKNAPPVILLLPPVDTETVLTGYKQGAAACLSKDTDTPQIYDALCRVAAHGVYMSPATEKLLLAQATKEKSENPPPVIFDEEQRQLIEMAAKQTSYRVIGARLCKSKRTIEEWASKMIHHLGCKNMKGVIAYAVKTGQIEGDHTPVA